MADGAFAALEMSGRLEAGEGRCVRARCPGCGVTAGLDVSPWIAMGLAGQPLESLERRLRCLCGARRARLEIWPEPALPDGGVWIFR